MRSTDVRIALLAFFAMVVTGASRAAEQRIDVADDAGLRQALRGAQAGARIVLATGTYRPEVYINGLKGTKTSPIIIEGADPRKKPAFEGGRQALHFADCQHLILRNIAVRGQSVNGINIDDGGSFDTPAHHVTVEGVDVSEIGPRGNHDPLKLSGVDDFVVRGCRFEGWAGQAIDMVGCHRGLIAGCSFRGKDGFEQGTGPQTKGGSSEIIIRNCTFVNAGERGVNIGGSTSLMVFRPQGARYEAKDITVEGCRFVGGMAAVAFVGVDGATVRYNTIYHPDKWVLRILQETTEKEFAPCRNGRLEGNLIVFQRNKVQVVANIGPNTNPRSFMFSRNWWYCEDNPRSSRPQLPAAERDGVYGVDPKMSLDPEGVPATPSLPAAEKYGAQALPAMGER